MLSYRKMLKKKLKEKMINILIFFRCSVIKYVHVSRLFNIQKTIKIIHYFEIYFLFSLTFPFHLFTLLIIIFIKEGRK